MRKPFVLLVIASLWLPSCRKAAAPSPSPASTAPPAARAAPGAGQPAGAAPAIKPMPANIPPVVARVNGEAIERWEFDNAVKRIEARAGAPVPPDKRDEVLRSVLDQLIAYHLLAQERSEEHTSELQSRLHLVCRLLLEKKKAPRNAARKNGRCT